MAYSVSFIYVLVSGSLVGSPMSDVANMNIYLQGY
jgi:hypothetical protein